MATREPMLKAATGFVFSTIPVVAQSMIENQFYLSQFSSAVVAILGTAILYFYLEPILSHLPRSIAWLRRRFEHMSSAEGIWLEVVRETSKNMGKYSVIEITYRNRYDDFVILGSNFTDDLHLLRNFTAKQFYVERQSDRALYYYKADPESDLLIENPSDTPGVGVIDFRASTGAPYHEASGFFADKNPASVHTFKWVRVSNSEIFQATGKKKFEDNEDRQTFLKWYKENILGIR